MKMQALSHSEISLLCQELAILLHAGVDVGGGLSLLAEEEAEAGDFALLLREMALQIDGGQTLENAFRRSGRIPESVCLLIGVGEQTGHLEETLQSLAAYHDRRARLDRHLRSALLYPAMLLLIMLVVIVVLLTQVLPVFNDVYGYLGGRLTGVAGGLLSIGRALGRALPLLCVLLVGAVVFLALFACSTTFRQRLLELWRRLMGERGVCRKLNMAQFAQALSMGMLSGLPAEEVLTMSSALFFDLPGASQRCADCLVLLAQGETLAKAMEKTHLLPAAECRLLELAARGGTGDTAMLQIAERLMEEAERALEERLGQVEPTLVVVSSVLVGLILLSVMLPLMNIMTAVG